MRPSRVSTPVGALLLAALYVIGGVLGNRSSFMGGTVALVWPPSGIALAGILLFGYRMWWGVAIGAWVFTLAQGSRFGSPFGFFTISTAIGNTVGAIVCAYLLERFVGFQNSMERLKHAIGFIVFACFLGTTVNATFNAMGLCFSHMLAWDQLFTNVVVWWVPNAMGALVVTPILLAWSSPSSLRLASRWPLECCCCIAGLIVGTQMSFNSWFVYGVENYPLAFLPYPFLVWGALRFGQRGGTTGTLVVATLSIYELLHRRGPFWLGTDKTSLMLIGCYIGVVAVGNLLLASASVEREIAVRQTEESEKRYRGVVEDQSDLVCRFLPDGTLVFVNQAYCRFHGKTRGQLIGSNFFPSLMEQDREIPLQEFARMTPQEPMQSFDNKLLLDHGRLLWQQCTVRALFDESGQLTEFQAVIQDITRRKESEEALRLGEERLRAILDSMVDGVLVLDQEGRVTLFNPAAERIFLRPAAEVLRQPVQNLLAADDWPKYRDYLSRHLGQNPPKIIEVNGVRGDGQPRPIDLAVSEIIRGAAPMWIVIVRDITERKRLEDQYRQAQKMEAVGRLAGGIAHDFNNLMQAILGYSNLLDRRLGPDDPNHETIKNIQRSLDHASSLTRQLLAFSRKQVLKPKLLALNKVVAEMTHLLQRVLGETVQLKLSLAEPVACIRADPGQMEQLILNLAINARDAMPQGGVLSIETSHVVLTETRTFSSGPLAPGSYALLTVSDTGCGMTAEVLAHLFEPFYTTKDIGKGTGLGLSNVYGVVKQTGGEITVTTTVGKGTSFHIYLPRFEGRPGEEESTHLKPSGGGHETVLLVEDEELVRSMFVEVLKSAGYDVLEATQGSEALALAERFPEPIDLLVTDVTMPGFSGVELARRLGATRPDMRVLFVSGYTGQEAEQWGKLDRPVQFLQKPFHSDALLNKVRRILDHQEK